jgi:transcriptional regulator with XRE-family HTH domain
LKSIHDAAYRRFLAKLIAARNAADISQQELATRLGKHQTYVSKVERGDRFLDLLEFLLWTRELGADPVELLADLAREVQQRKPKRVKLLDT